MEEKMEWMERLDDRQRAEVKFARLYAKEFHHGTTGHNALMIIARMADLLDGTERAWKQEASRQ